MDHGFTFDGRHVHEFGAAFLATKWPGSAAVSPNKATVSGRDGTIRYAGQTFLEKSLEGELYLLDPDDELMSYTQMLERADEIVPWLQPGGRRPLILDAQPERMYMAEIERAIEFDTESWQNGMATLSFVLQPFAYALAASLLPYTLAAGVEQSKTLVLPGTVEAPLLVELTAAAALDWLEITAGGKQLRLEGLGLQAGGTLSLTALPENGEVLTVRRNGTPCRGLVTQSSVFPLFVQPGKSTLTAAAGGACTVQAGARGRWK